MKKSYLRNYNLRKSKAKKNSEAKVYKLKIKKKRA